MKYIILILITTTLIATQKFEEVKKHAWYKYSDQYEYKLNDESEKNRLFLKVDVVGLEEDGEVLKGKLINTTKKTKKITTEDGSLIMIMEALNKETWEPIEYWAWSDCGNSYFHPLELKKNNTVEVNIPIFMGDIKTKMRLRLCTGDEIIFSNEFIGTVNKEKLIPLKKLPFTDIEWDDLYLKRCISE